MGGDEDEPRRYTKAWVRANWDHERETAPKDVQIVKIAHEWHIPLLSVAAGLSAAIIARGAGASVVESVLASVSFFGVTLTTLFNNLWCSTLAGTEPTESTGDDVEPDESEADLIQEQHQ